MIHWDSQEIKGALAGGVLISIAITLNYFIYGRREGMHDMVKGVFKARFRQDMDSLMRICFIFGVVLVPYFVSLAGHESV